MSTIDATQDARNGEHRCLEAITDPDALCALQQRNRRMLDNAARLVDHVRRAVASAAPARPRCAVVVPRPRERRSTRPRSRRATRRTRTRGDPDPAHDPEPAFSEVGYLLRSPNVRRRLVIR
ncbi:MAG: hypothetical protein WKF96_25690, partial [Solirubrobacteraceae bacterium]